MTFSTFYTAYLQRSMIFFLAYLFIGFQFPCKAQERLNIFRPLNLKWLYEFNPEENSTPASAGKVVYAYPQNGNILALQSTSGDFLWARENGGTISSSPIADNNSLYIASTIAPPPTPKSQRKPSGLLRALSSANGVTRWTRSIPSPLIGFLRSNETAIFGCSSDGGLYSIDKDTGTILWVKYNSVSFNLSPQLLSEVIFISDKQGNIFKLDQVTGKTIKRYQTRAGSLNSLAIDNKKIFASTSDGFVYSFDETNGRLLWRVKLNGSIQYVTNSNKCLLANSADNFIYCLSPQRGIRLWKRRLAGRISAQPLILDGSILLTTVTGEECVVLSLNDGRLINSIYIGQDNATKAAPILSDNLILLTTRKGLFAYSNQSLDDAPK